VLHHDAIPHQNMEQAMRKIFTDDVLLQITQWVASGQRADEIAQRLGTTPSSLKVSCSKFGISLRPPNWKEQYRRTLASRRGEPSVPGPQLPRKAPVMEKTGTEWQCRCCGKRAKLVTELVETVPVMTVIAA
jgi:hypothetical protein